MDNDNLAQVLEALELENEVLAEQTCGLPDEVSLLSYIIINYYELFVQEV